MFPCTPVIIPELEHHNESSPSEPNTRKCMTTPICTQMDNGNVIETSTPVLATVPTESGTSTASSVGSSGFHLEKLARGGQNLNAENFWGAMYRVSVVCTAIV